MNRFKSTRDVIRDRCFVDKKIPRLAVAVLAFGCVSNLLAQAPAPAPPETAAQQSQSPCSSLTPMPPEMQSQLAAMAEARKAKKPMPPPSPADMAVYMKWQERSRLEDFGGECTYEAANAKLGPATDHRIVFFGDSITQGWPLSDPTLFGGDVVNRGISGQTTAQMLVRFRQDVVDLHPRAVHILAGVNDLAGNTGPSSVARVESHLLSMIDMARANHIQVFLASELPSTVIPWRPGLNVSADLRALNAWMREIAPERGVTYVDYYSALVGQDNAFDPKLTLDGVHPNPAGYSVMNSVAQRALSPAR